MILGLEGKFRRSSRLYL